MADAAGLYYELHGREDGEPVVLSPGLGGSAGYWTPNCAALAEQYRVILYDHRGTGRSDRALPDHVTVDQMGDDIALLLDALGVGQAHIVGHAAGAIAGLCLALRQPERVRSLVMVNGWARPDPHFARAFDARLALLRHVGVAAYLRAQPLFLYPASWNSEHATALDEEAAIQLEHFQGVENLEKRVVALRDFDVDARLGSLAVPALGYAAKDDALVPWTLTCEMVVKAPGMEPLFVDYGGHACNVTEPERFHDAVLEFLSQHPMKG